MPDITTYLQPSKAYSTREIADLAKVSDASARQSLLRELKKEKVIRHVVKNKTYWALKP